MRRIVQNATASVVVEEKCGQSFAGRTGGHANMSLSHSIGADGMFLAREFIPRGGQ